MNDLLLDADFDLAFENGDFLTGESQEQEVEQIVLSQKGEWRQWPVIGFGIERYINKSIGSPVIDNRNRFIRELKIALAADGKQSANLQVNADLSDFKIELNE